MRTRALVSSPSVFFLVTACSACASCSHDTPASTAAVGADSGPGLPLDGGPSVGPGGGDDGGALPPAGDGGTMPGASGCKPITLDAGKTGGAYTLDVFTYYDAACKPRAASMARNGFLRQITYDAGGTTRTVVGTGTNGWAGFGYVVTHIHGGGDWNSQSATATWSNVFTGAHHAIYQLKLQANPGGAVSTTIQWVFATGRSHPLYTITYDASAAGKDTVYADSRSPYGDMGWDGQADGNGVVEGVGWGDKYKFITTSTGAVSQSTTWDYTKANVVPYVVQWSATKDAEMGLVATQSFATKVQGGDYFQGVLAQDCWAKTSTTRGAGCVGDLGTLPQSSIWPFQLNQYELPSGDNHSHRVAWGLDYGSVGHSSYSAFGQTLSGYPFQSYSVYVVLGKHSDPAVLGQTTDIERTIGAKMTAVTGTVPTSGPGGIARTDAVAYSPAGWNNVYATWDVQAASGAATVDLAAGAAGLKNPVLRVLGWTAAGPPSHVNVGGQELAANAGYFASVDAASKTLWLTLNQTVVGTARIAVQ